MHDSALVRSLLCLVFACGRFLAIRLAGRSQLWLVLLVAAIAGCAGYQVGTQSLYRGDIRTVYVPLFESDSFRRNLGERLTETVMKEIEAKTPYKVVQHPNADSILTGRIVGHRKRVVAKDANNQPRDNDTEFTVQVSWHDRRGGQIMHNAALPFAPLSLTVVQATNVLPESGQSMATAHQEAIQRLARQIVWQMETRW